MEKAYDIFLKEELSRYSRHLLIPEFGIEAQKKLKESKVLVIGSGGLGSPLLLYLCAAGIGNIGIIDDDVVDDSNLQRQILFSTGDIGHSKVEIAKQKLLGLNPYINIVVYNERLNSENALAIMQDYDVVADGTDNFPTRFLINDACVMLNKVNVFASVFQFEGQLSVFNFKDASGETGPNYRDLYLNPPPNGLFQNCSEAGVLGVLPGIMGSLQASEVIKVISGIGSVLSGKLFVFDALNFRTRILNIKKNPLNPINGQNKSINKLIDYEYSCESPIDHRKVKEISALEFNNLELNNGDYQLIDIREQYEHEIVNIGGSLIPLHKLPDCVDEISRTRKVIIYCKTGIRSLNAIERLEDEYGFTNLYNLRGGIVAYINEVNLNLPLY